MVTSYNGWTASTSASAIDIDPKFTAAGRLFPGGVKRGPVSVVFRYLVEQFNERVEPVDLYEPGDEWGYVYRQNRNAENLSCHSSGTAIDINATRHPNGKRGTFTRGQVDAIRSILDELNGVVRWGGDFTGTPDEMHFEITGTPTAVAKVAGRLLDAGKDVTKPPAPKPEEDDMPLPKVTYVKVQSDPTVYLAGLSVAPRPVGPSYRDLEYHLAKLGGVDLETPIELGYPARETDEIPDTAGEKRPVLIVGDGSPFGI